MVIIPTKIIKIQTLIVMSKKILIKFFFRNKSFKIIDYKVGLGKNIITNNNPTNFNQGGQFNSTKNSILLINFLKLLTRYKIPVFKIIEFYKIIT